MKHDEQQGTNAIAVAQGEVNEHVDDDKVEIENELKNNITRFIYVTHYTDSYAVNTMKCLFEEINQCAFNLRSAKEIYARELSQSEQNDNDIDYISGFQLIDNNIRVTIIEGIAQGAMKLVRERLPKTQMNTPSFKVLSDVNVLFNKRIYSAFGLSLKFIKLRQSLHSILTTYDLYEKANKFRDMYDAFINIGVVLQSETLSEIAEGAHFPELMGLLRIERKYGDMLTEEDLTGMKANARRNKKLRIRDIKHNDDNDNDNEDDNDDSSNMKRNVIINIIKRNNVNLNNRNKPLQSSNDSNGEYAINKKVKSLTDSRNIEYDLFLQKKSKYKITKSVLLQKNKEYIKHMQRKPTQGRFCQNISISSQNEKQNVPVYLYGSMRNNYYVNLAAKMYQKYSKDTNHYYSYSDHALTLSFPKITNQSEEYMNYVDNKRKFVCDKDFDRYKRVNTLDNRIERYVYLPKIKNVL